MNIIIPMAGLGSRFKKSGFASPKPLIPVARKFMYRHAVDCLPLSLATNLVFILRQDNFTKDLILDIKTHYTRKDFHCEILVLNQETQGQAETVLRSASILDFSRPSLIHNCDTYISPDIPWQTLIQKKTDGVLILFNSQETRWSYAKLDQTQSKIIDVQEKKVISFHASTGTYMFKKTRELIHDIENIIQNDLREKGEYYLSTVCRRMIGQQKNLLPVWSNLMLCFGAPPDLAHSLNTILINDNLREKFL